MLRRGDVEAVHGELIGVLREARALLALPGNDFVWSRWEDAADALAELDGHIAVVESGQLPPRMTLSVLFGPTGPIQEVSIGSGWRGAFLDVTARFDGAANRAYARPGALLIERMKTLRRGLLIALLLGFVGVWLWLLWLASSYDRPYCRVDDGLYIGSSVNQPPPGTKAVVNLCGREDPYSVEASLWEPVFESGKEPSLEWLSRVVEFIATQRRAGRTTYVHCLAGMNRSGAAVTAYLMQEHGWSRDEALAYLQKKRPQVQPNSTLMRLLAEWENALKEKESAGK
jgi:hypothetical protein